MSLDKDAVQARLTLVQYLYRESLLGVSQALALVKQPPLAAEEKEALFGEVERAVWDFPDEFFIEPPLAPEGWAERATNDARIREALDSGVTRILTARKRGLPSP